MCKNLYKLNYLLMNGVVYCVSHEEYKKFKKYCDSKNVKVTTELIGLNVYEVRKVGKYGK